MSPDVDSLTHPCASWIKWVRPEIDVETEEIDDVMNGVPQIEDDNGSQQTTQTLG